MRTYSITDTRIHLSRLIERAATGECFIITKFGKSLVKVIALNPSNPPTQKRFGFMAGQIKIPADFNRMGSRKIRRLLEAKK